MDMLASHFCYLGKFVCGPGPHGAQQISCAPLPTNIVCATPKKYRVRHSQKISCAPLPKNIVCATPKNPRTNLEARGPIWRYLVMKAFPRMSKIMYFNETHYSVRQNAGSTGSISIRNMFPLHPVTPKWPESPYGAKYLFFAENPVFQFFGLQD